MVPGCENAGSAGAGYLRGDVVGISDCRNDRGRGISPQKANTKCMRSISIGVAK